MKTFKNTLEIAKRVLPVLVIVAGILGSFPSTLISNVQIRQEINITDSFLYAGSGSSATSSEQIGLTDTKYSSPTYYFEVDASTTAGTTATVALVNATSGAAITNTTISITGGNTYTRYRSAAFNPTSSSTVDYAVRLGSEAIGKGVSMARIVILQNAPTLDKTETQIEIGNNETFASNATSTFASPKYWTYTSSAWDGSPTFTAEVDYNIIKGVASTTGFKTAGTFTITNPAGTASTSIMLIAGGGAGGGSSGTSGGGGGGVGGQAALSTTTANGVSHTLVVGSGPTGGTGAGTAGGDSTWDATVVVAKGGAGGAATTGGTIATTSGSTTGCVAQTCYAGGSNGSASATVGGAGGGGAGTTGAGGNSGGAFGGTGTFAGGQAGGARQLSNAVGNNASTTGGGGGGGSFRSSSSKAGGNGGSGLATTTNYIATTTIAIQEDNGSFGSWTDKAYMVTAQSNGVATSTRARVSFTPTTGRHYRIATSNGDGRTKIQIYNAKVIVDQTGGLSNATYASKSLDATTQDTFGEGAYLSSDLATLYYAGATTPKIYQYTLSTPGDLSTATFASKSVSVSSQGTSPFGVSFNSDRSSMYVFDGGNHKVFQYTLSTPGDVSTASYASKSFDTSSQTGSMGSFAFNSDLSKMYVTDPTNAKVYQYILSTPGDVSTASYGSVSFTLSSQESQPSGIFLSANGAKMYVIGSANKTVYQYTLSTPGDPSTATYDSVSVSTSGQTTTPRSMFISSDGTKMYIADHTGNKVYQYTINTLSKLEPRYLLSNTKLLAGTNLQGNLTSWNSAEWNTNNTYTHEVDAAASSVSVVGIYTAGNVLVTGSTVTSPNNVGNSSAMTMPANGDLDVKATTNNNDIFSNRIVVDVTPAQTTLADTSDPSNVTIAPGAAGTLADAFTLQTNVGTDAITAVTLSLGTGAHTGIQYVEITDSGGNFTYGTSTTPTTDSPVINLTGLTANTSLTTYKIKITPLSHANMPAVPGATYTVTPKISSFVGSNAQTGSDTAGTTLTIDNLSPGDVTGALAIGGNDQVSLTWTKPGDSDLSRVMVVASTSAITFVPTEGTTYSTSTLSGASRVACYGLQTSCFDTSITDGTPYFYKIFTTDTNGNWSTPGVTPSGSPNSGYALTEQSYRFYAATSTYDGVNWTSQTSAADNAWSDIAYGNGTYVAVSSGDEANGVMTSPDGVNWIARTPAAANAWQGVTYGNGIFVAVSSDGTSANDVMTSTDGITWTSQTSAAADQWESVTYGNGLFVAVNDNDVGGHRVMTSPDGVTWTLQSTPAAINWERVSYGNGLFVATSIDSTGQDIMTSPDGINWTQRNTDANHVLGNVAYGNGLYVAVSKIGAGSNNNVETSPDGVTWTSRASVTSNSWRRIVYGNGLFVAISQDGTGNRVMTSTDGINWTAQTSAADIAWRNIVYGNGLFVAVANTGVGNRVMTSGSDGPHVGQALAATSTATTLSVTGMNFRLRLLNRVDGGTDTVGTLPSLKLQYATKSGSCDTAFSGETYADITDSTPISYYDDPVYTNGDFLVSTTTDLLDAARTIKSEQYRENNNFVATSSLLSAQSGLWDFSLYDNGASGSSDYCIREVASTDAQTWTARTLANTDWLGLTYGSSTFVAVADVSTNGVVTSPDGLTWTAHNNANGNGWESIAFGTTSAVAVSYNALSNNQEVERSTDGGLTWTAKTATSIDDWSSVAFGNGIFVAVSVQGHVMYSTDGGNTWTAGTAAAANAWRSVTYGNGLFVAVSSSGTNRVMTSADGAHWTSYSAAEANSWQSVVYGNGLFVASASGGTHSIMTSTNGVRWSPQTGPTNISGSPSTGMTYGNGLFVTLDHSTGKVATSPDGINWSYSPLPSGSWMSVAYGNGTFAGVGIGCGSSCAMTASTSSSTLDFYNNGGTSYSFERPITIQHGQVSNTNQTQFPILIDEQDAWLATSLAGGKIQNTTTQTGSGIATTVPADLIFTSDSSCNNKLNWEYESYGTTTGRVRVWVQDSISASVDTTLYECYGNSSVKTWQGNVAGTWDQNYAGVFHMPDGTTLNPADSTLNGNTGSGVNGPTAVTGQIGGAGNFASTSKQSINLGSNQSLSPSALSYSAWVKATSFPNTYNSVVNRVGNVASGLAYFQLFVRSDGKLAGYASTTASSGVNYDDTGSNTLSSGTWYYLTLTYDSSSGLKGYVNGVSDGTASANGSLVTSAVPTSIGDDSNINGRAWNGAIDEVEISNVVRSSDWIKTEYNNQSATSTFYTVGAEASVSGALPSIAEVITAAGQAVSQLHYGWRNDDGNEAAATFAAAQDTALTSGVYKGDTKRVRFLLSGSGTSNNYTYQLEQSSSTCTSWIAVPTTNTNGTHWMAAVSQYFLDGAVTTNNSTLTDPGGKSFVASVAKSGSTLTSGISLTSSQFTELEYTIKSTQAVTPGTTYCFRVTNAGDASQFAYTQTPQIQVQPGGTRPQNGGSTTEGSGTGPTVSGGNEAGGGTGSSGNAGGESGGTGGSHGGGNSGGGGGGDTGFLFPKNFFALFIQLPIDFTIDPLLSIKEKIHS